MAKELQIREATIADIPRLIKLLHQVNMVHHDLRPDLFKPQTTKYDEAQLADMIATETQPIFVSEDGMVNGYVFCQIQETRDDRLLQDRRTLYIDDLCVDAQARGKHIGRQLLDYVRRFAEQQGCQSITLNVWTGNEAALTFYQKAGMQVLKTCMEMKLTTKG